MDLNGLVCISLMEKVDEGFIFTYMGVRSRKEKRKKSSDSDLDHDQQNIQNMVVQVIMKTI